MNCLDCGHDAGQHEVGTAPCLMDCPCDTLHLDLGDCTDECYAVSV